MNKLQYLKEIQNRLPDNLVIRDETLHDFTEDEFIGILSWLKYFNNHYKDKQKTESPSIVRPIIST
ncbi:hypothetical protein [Pedobacter sp.]|uniref:hypothetical protein n=1 Tax=Pedobacter sp. TaxID=1411316 RepID=UPI0031CF1098